MDMVLREQILREIKYILKYEYLTEEEKHWYDDIWGDAKEAYGYWFGSGGKQALKHPLDTIRDAGRAANMMGKDIAAAWEEDPWAFVQGLLDVVSLFEPTGIADILNAVIYFSRGNNLMGTISAVCGGLTLVGAILTLADGAGLPIVILGKTIKGMVVLKDAVKLQGICKKIVMFAPKIIEAVKGLTKYAIIGEKATFVLGKLTSFFSRIKTYLANTSSFKTFDQGFEFIFGSGKLTVTKGPINTAKFAEISTKQTGKTIGKTAGSFSKTTAIGQGGGLIATAGGLASVGEEGRKRKGAELYLRNSEFCQISDCNTIYYNKKEKLYYDKNTGQPDNLFNAAIGIAISSNLSMTDAEK